MENIKEYYKYGEYLRKMINPFNFIATFPISVNKYIKNNYENIEEFIKKEYKNLEGVSEETKFYRKYVLAGALDEVFVSRFELLNKYIS